MVRRGIITVACLVYLDIWLSNAADDFGREVSFRKLVDWFFSSLVSLGGDVSPALRTHAQNLVQGSNAEPYQASAT